MSGVVGSCRIMHGLVRSDYVLAENTADIFRAMKGCSSVLIDSMHLFIVLQRRGVSEMSLIYTTAVMISVAYEAYVLYLSRRAYNLRKYISKTE